MNASVLSLITISVLISSLAQIMLKIGMNRFAMTATFQIENLVSSLMAVFANSYVLGGLFCYGLGAIVWLAVLSRVEVSVAYPFTGLGVAFTAILAYVVLGENLGMQRLLGTTLVMAGVILVGRSA